MLLKLKENSYLTFLIFILFSYSLSANSPFFTRGEAREALVVEAMNAQDNYILPLRNGIDVPSKPPMFHWIASIVLNVFPAHQELSIRLPSILASVFAMLILYIFLRNKYDYTTSLTTTLMLGSCFDWIKTSSVARVDMVFSTFLLSSHLLIYLIIEEYLSKAKINYKNLTLLSLAISAAVLTKGPAGLAFPWIVGGMFIVLKLKIKRIPFIPVIFSILFSLGIAGIWYYAAYLQQGEMFLDVHLMRENIARVVGNDDYDTGHKSPFYMIYVLFIVGVMPWSLFLPLLLKYVRDEKHKLQNNENNLFLYSIIWLLFYLIFFSFTSSKRNVYLLPAYPSFFLLFASYLAKYKFEHNKILSMSRYLLNFFSGVAIIVTAAIVCIIYNPDILIYFSIKERDRSVVNDIISTFGEYERIIFIFILATTCLFIIKSSYSLLTMKLQKSIQYLLIAMFLLTSDINQFIVPKFAEATSSKIFVEKCQNKYPDVEKFQYEDNYYVLNYYYKNNLAIYNSLNAKCGNYYVFSLKNNFTNIVNKYKNAVLIEESEKFDFYGKDKFVLIDLNNKCE